MTYTIKIRSLPGSPMLCEYECPSCGRFELLVSRDDRGDPPAAVPCPSLFEDSNFPLEDPVECDKTAELTISAPSIKFWSRDPVALNPAGATRDDKPDPRALDTRPLAEGKMTKAEWRKWQRGISAERRYQKRLKAGRISKRIQVGGG